MFGADRNIGRKVRSSREEREGWVEQTGTGAGWLGAVERRVRGGRSRQNMGRNVSKSREKSKGWAEQKDIWAGCLAALERRVRGWRSREEHGQGA